MKQFIVTTKVGGSVDVIISGRDEEHYDTLDAEQKIGYIKHEAWRVLWKSEAAKMLRDLCDKLGVTQVQKGFELGCQVEEV